MNENISEQAKNVNKPQREAGEKNLTAAHPDTREFSIAFAVFSAIGILLLLMLLIVIYFNTFE